MHARNILLFASVLLPVIGAPVPTKETNSIQQRSANVVSQLSSYVSKRDPLIERIPEKALSDIVFETKRDADAEDTPAVGGDDDFVEEEEEDDVIDLEVDSSEVDPTKRGLRGNSGAGGGKRSIRGNDGLSGDKRDIPEAMVAARGVRPGNGNNHKTRGVRPGSGNNPRGVRPKKGNNQRGVRPGRGNNPRGAAATTKEACVQAAAITPGV
ncbi:hypothetical protein BKA58DRAFT_404381 [Alternaria rosae]|uniref:uncharacterized protein n=1 Tax=Alternaria rosae TaxID=1187941 RepID=UPI001E8CB2AA|nr:uncharacterized protein BKA58DRAFT_404381 [Alternaria rosae]KAH6865839.1 hypothetical protein BKA58DRAFT_404381 [Alternaria rosae]